MKPRYARPAHADRAADDTRPAGAEPGAVTAAAQRPRYPAVARGFAGAQLTRMCRSDVQIG
jgi:hypothetical protein